MPCASDGFAEPTLGCRRWSREELGLAGRREVYGETFSGARREAAPGWGGQGEAGSGPLSQLVLLYIYHTIQLLQSIIRPFCNRQWSSNIAQCLRSRGLAKRMIYLH